MTLRARSPPATAVTAAGVAGAGVGAFVGAVSAVLGRGVGGFDAGRIILGVPGAVWALGWASGVGSRRVEGVCLGGESGRACILEDGSGGKPGPKSATGLRCASCACICSASTGSMANDKQTTSQARKAGAPARSHDMACVCGAGR